MIPSSNRSTTSLEKNLLFYADQRFSVTQQGSVSLPVSSLFDGNFSPVYSDPVNEANPYVLLIEGLPRIHTQAGVWIGWTTRYWWPTKFKIEIFNTYENANAWVTIANVQNHDSGSYILPFSGVEVSKIRLTVYRAAGENNRLGLSEFYFIHPEAASAYDNLLVRYSGEGNVGIGTSTPNEKLSVNGRIRAKEIKVETANFPDYVFEEDYQLSSLADLEKYIQTHKHLPEIPTAKQVETEGLAIGEMNKLLLKKVEELTLYLIRQEKKLDDAIGEIENLKSKMK
ncbi:hypothetical protein DU508_00100 [Pedobacter chinensis]|uniref:Uncharacterized protein n=2 Tax=Pedobacter chinensis TaxID=2282421 RepID=A0A369Q4P3_9SPHI|nr:hypothetical protein DU508_00100 [Pedobacter chinensis]